ncbi:MAG: hypothetical protein ACPLRN_00360 [Microgenomates group bacterium]
MEKKDPPSLLEIKKIPSENKVIGQCPLGGVIKIGDRLYWLRHPQFRWNGSSWGWENDGFGKSDLSEIGYHIKLIPQEETVRLAKEQIDMIKNGILPKDWTVGIELEGALYDKSGNLISKYDGKQVKIEDDFHPELLSFTIETATKSSHNKYPQTSIEITHALAQAINEGYEIARKRNGLIVYSSVPEAGNFFQAQITPHPYLLAFAPKVLDFTLKNWSMIPQETKDLYSLLNIDIKQYLTETGILNWPVQALHIHTGIPQIDGLVDTRIAYVYGNLRQSLMAKVVSFMLYNTCYLYGVDTNLLDVRSIARRLLATTIDSSLPNNAQDLINEMIRAMEKGLIHSPSRYPPFGQHDRVRFRAEGQYKTIESIDGPMTPDLRLILAWVFFNQILNVVGLEAIIQTGGDETKALEYLQRRWGNLFLTIPTTGKNSSFEADLIFNQYGYGGIFFGQSFKQWLINIKQFLELFQQQYPYFLTQAITVEKMIENQLAKPGFADLASYLGIEKGDYQPNGQNLGILTSHKKDLPPKELIMVQNQATYLQAKILSEIRDEKDLLAFFDL